MAEAIVVFKNPFQGIRNLVKKERSTAKPKWEVKVYVVLRLPVGNWAADAVVRVRLKPMVFLCAPVHSERDLWSDQGWLPALILWPASTFQPDGHGFQ